jgi:hypothetical protein
MGLHRTIYQPTTYKKQIFLELSLTTLWLLAWCCLYCGGRLKLACMNWERGLEGCVGLCRDRILIFAAEREPLEATDLRTPAVIFEEIFLDFLV